MMSICTVCFLMPLLLPSFAEADPDRMDINPMDSLIIEHMPDPAIPVEIDKEHDEVNTCRWTYSTVLNNNSDKKIKVISFSVLAFRENKWVNWNVDDRVFEHTDFCEWYIRGDGLVDGWIMPGSTATDDNNWVESFPIPYRCKWRYELEDKEGNRCISEKEVELTPYCVEKAANKKAQKNTLIKGKIINENGSTGIHAQVHISPYSSRWREPLFSCISDSDGRYEIQVPNPGIFYVCAYAQGAYLNRKVLIIDSDDSDYEVDFYMVQYAGIEDSETEFRGDMRTDEDLEYLHDLFEIENNVESEVVHFMNAIEDHTGTECTNSVFDHEWDSIKRSLSATIESEKEGIVRCFAAYKLSEVLYYDSNLDELSMKTVLDVLEPSSSYWSIHPMYTANLFAKYYDKVGIRQFKAFCECDQDRLLKAYSCAHLALLMKKLGKNNQSREYYDKAVLEYAGVKEIAPILNLCNPYSAVKIGKDLPPFRVKLFDSDSTVTNETMRGKYYLIHVWSTWCGPCKRDMKYLHEAYKRYASRNFDMISISFDRDTAKFRKFRDELWPLPWLNVLEREGQNSQTARQLEVLSVPKMILVDQNGVILEVGGALRGDKLVGTLEKYLN